MANTVQMDEKVLREFLAKARGLEARVAELEQLRAVVAQHELELVTMRPMFEDYQGHLKEIESGRGRFLRDVSAEQPAPTDLDDEEFSRPRDEHGRFTSNETPTNPEGTDEPSTTTENA